MLDLDKIEANLFHQKIQANSETAAGGVEAFATLVSTAQANLYASEYQRSVRLLGEAAFNESSLVLHLEMICLARGGCCMYKDMNALRGGTSVLSKFWKDNKHFPPPVILINKDNDATI